MYNFASHAVRWLLSAECLVIPADGHSGHARLSRTSAGADLRGRAPRRTGFASGERAMTDS